jgi:hypothetical protein
MPPAKFEFKSLAGIGFGALALLVSLYSCHTANRVAEEVLAPRLTIADLQLQGTHPDDVAEEEPILRYKIANQGRSSLHNVQMAEIITTDKSKKTNRENRVIESVDPGDPVDGVTYLTPSVLIPTGFTAMDMEDGKLPLTVQFETEASTDEMPQYRTCQRFNYDHLKQKFNRTSECTPEIFK